MEFAPPPPPRGVLDISLGGEVRPGDGKTAWLIAEPVSLYKHTHLFFLSHGGQAMLSFLLFYDTVCYLSK